MAGKNARSKNASRQPPASSKKKTPRSKRVVVRKPPVQIARTKKHNAPRGVPPCPSYNAVMAFTFPVAHRSNQFVINAGTSALGVFAPFNDVLGNVFSQAVSPPNAVAVPTQVPIIDPYLTSLLTPVTTSGATNALAARWTSFCVEFMVSDALASINSTMSLVRWTQNGVPLVSTVGASEFFSIYNSINDHPKLIEVPCAQLTHTHCLHTSMLERSALDFTPIATGLGPWSTVYGNTASSTTVGSFNTPWAPIVGLLSSSSNVTVRIVIRGTIQVVAPPNNYLSRLCKKLPVGGPSSESDWWRHCDTMRDSKISVSTGLPSRSTIGFTGR